MKSFRDMARPAKIVIVLALYFFKILRVLGLALLELVIAGGDMISGLAGRQHWRAELHAIRSRVAISIVMREWLRVMVKLSIAEGAPIIYANFLGYDEQAHRRGPDSAFAHWGLKGIDNVVADVFRAAHTSDARDYQVVVFADHGQERAEIYEVAHGVTIQDAVKKVFAAGPLAGTRVHRVDLPGGRTQEMDQRAHWLFRSKRGRLEAPRMTAEQLANDIIVTALGPLGHVYLPVELGDDQRAAYAKALVKEGHTPLVLYLDAAGVVHARNRRGAWRLPDDAVPIFGPRHPFIGEAAADLERLCRHPDAGAFVISGWDSERTPVTFVQENGAHGSIGVDETRGFALIPHGVRVHVRRGHEGEQYLRGEDLYRAAWRFVHPDRPLPRRPAGDAAGSPADEAAEPGRPARSGVGGSNGHAGDGRPTLRVMTYNIHSCIGLDGKARPERIAQVIRSSRADLIALQEVDANRHRSRRHDQARIIAESLSMSHHYYAISDWNGEQYGLAIISRYPLEHLQSGHLTAAEPSRRAEARGAMWVRVDTPVGPVHLINTHFGLRREERLRQAELLLGPDWIGGVPRGEPVILCGDLNAGPRSPVCRSFSRLLVDAQTQVKNHRPRATFFSPMPVRRLDHIFVSPHFRVEHVLLPRTPAAKIASDHLPVCAELTLTAAADAGRDPASVEARSGH
jgi:endonuclease/exonuclease/phosphatase family metal-dependent hydrolase